MNPANQFWIIKNILNIFNNLSIDIEYYMSEHIDDFKNYFGTICDTITKFIDQLLPTGIEILDLCSKNVLTEEEKQKLINFINDSVKLDIRNEDEAILCYYDCMADDIIYDAGTNSNYFTNQKNKINEKLLLFNLELATPYEYSPHAYSTTVFC